MRATLIFSRLPVPNFSSALSNCFRRHKTVSAAHKPKDEKRAEKRDDEPGLMNQHKICNMKDSSADISPLYWRWTLAGDNHIDTSLDYRLESAPVPVAANNSNSQHELAPVEKPPPDPPVSCCMSGCANCLWIQYAEDLRDYYKDGGVAAREAIEKNVLDPSMKAFLLTEIK